MKFVRCRLIWLGLSGPDNNSCAGTHTCWIILHSRKERQPSKCFRLQFELLFSPKWRAVSQLWFLHFTADLFAFTGHLLHEDMKQPGLFSFLFFEYAEQSRSGYVVKAELCVPGGWVGGRKHATLPFVEIPTTGNEHTQFRSPRTSPPIRIFLYFQCCHFSALLAKSGDRWRRLAQKNEARRLLSAFTVVVELLPRF